MGVVCSGYRQGPLFSSSQSTCMASVQLAAMVAVVAGRAVNVVSWPWRWRLALDILYGVLLCMMLIIAAHSGIRHEYGRGCFELLWVLVMLKFKEIDK
jgi:hypothetical protein